ncbi:cache domain-containing sensor histidine kinase [Paenibacillus abyssi]|uniref:Histidine kinase n=1 Tax=Paenibacillus abyssi TaxID=1340531 RepID=A0A917CT97_9BACL|nr:sensor histidine kinase [Paenibacillus abyssi]GGF96210.1 histidine kinase [Paenibacillus abyssi]
MKLLTSSLRNKLILFLVIAIVLPMVTSIGISYFYTRESMKNEFIRENSNTVYQGKINLSEYLEQMNQISLSAYNNLQEKNSLYNIVADGRGDYQTEKQLYNALNSIASANKDILQVYLHRKKTNDSFLIIDGFFKRAEGIDILGGRFPLPDNRYDPYFEFAHTAHNYGMNDFPYAPSDTVFTLHRPIYRAPLKEWIGTLSIDFKLNALANLSDLLYIKGSEEIYMMDMNGMVIYSSEEELIGTTLEDSWTLHLKSMTSPSGHFDWSSQTFKGTTIYETIGMFNTKWLLAKRIPNDVMYRNAEQFVRINALVIALSLVVIVAAAVYISFKLTLPIKQLIASVKKIKLRNLKLDIDSKSTDEIGLLADTIQNMVGTIDSLITKEYRLEIANKDNQLKALQAQINPHFIYNTLQSIGSIALQNNVLRIYDLTSSLGKMMRYNMNTNETIVPLSKEIEHITAYLELQKQRFKQQLTSHMTIDERAKDIQIPKMILQPIIENYFKHGFDQQIGVGEIWIHIEQIDASMLRINVQDNGKGVETSRLQQLQQQLLEGNEQPSHQESIGLFNVLSRLKLYFHPEATIGIANREPNGFSVTLWIPLQEERQPE